LLSQLCGSYLFSSSGARLIHQPPMASIVGGCLPAVCVDAHHLHVMFAALHHLVFVQDISSPHRTEILCKLVNSLPVFSTTCSIYSMAALAEERYRAIVLGPTHAIYRKTALQIIGGIWILSTVVATPTFFDYSVHPGPMTSQDVGNTTAVSAPLSCMPKSDVFDMANGVFILCTSYMIPQAFIFSRYYRLVTFIVRQGQQTTGGLTSSFVSHNRTRIIKMLIIIAVLFSFAWLPYFVLLVGAKMTGQSSSAEGASGFVLVQLTLAVFSTSYNIVIYLIYNTEFRRSFLGIFCCVRPTTVHPSLSGPAGNTNIATVSVDAAVPSHNEHAATSCNTGSQ
ncbi:hypothetical protein LSAT2_018627, partial [Lamellibrachia satsuma]